MNPDGVQSPELIQDFRGEQRTIAENLLPGNVSPDALNIDYRDGTVRKRRGVLRTGFNALKGGCWVSQEWSGAANGRRYARSGNITLSGTLHTYNFLLSDVRYETVSGDVRIFVHGTSGGNGTGLWLKNNAGSYRLEARVEHSGGTLAVMHSNATVNGAIRVQFDTATKTLTLQVGGTSNSSALGGGDTYTQPSGRIYLGGKQSDDNDKNFLIQEFRLWDGAVGAYLSNSAPYATLSEAQQTSALRAWWRFADVSSTGFVDGSGNGFTMQPSGEPIGCMVGNVVGDDLYWDDIEALLIYKKSLSVGVYGAVATRRRFTVGAGGFGSGAMGYLGTDEFTGWRDFRAQLLLHRDRVVAVNGAGENLIEGGEQLSYAAPAMTGPITITASGSGGSLDVGVYRYLFSIYNSVSGVESAVGTEISSQTAVSSDKFTLDFTTGGFMPGRFFRGADKIRIYRTKAGGAVYYHLADIDIYATSYEDGAADSGLVTIRPEYVGYAAPSRFGFVLNGSLWLGNQSGAENRLVYSEPNTLGGFYSENYIDLGDSEELTGGVVLGNRAVVFKAGSTWLVTGAGPGVAAQLLFPGVGCVQHATIASSHERVFWLGRGGVYTMGSDLGTPESLTLDGWRDFFDGMDSDDYEACSGFWDPISERYFLGFSVSGVRRTLVWHHRRRAWALWDLPLTGFVLDLDSTAIYAGLRNQVVQLEYGLSDGHYANDLFGQNMYGTATGGSSTTLVDSGAQWMTDNGGKLIGVSVRVTYLDGTTATRTVMGNTDTQLTVDAPWTAPVAGCTYELGPINAYWSTPRLSPHRWDRVCRLDRAYLLSKRIDFDDVAAVDEVTVQVLLDEYESGAGRAQSFSWPVGRRVTNLAVTSGQSREFRVKVSDDSSKRSFDLAGIGLRVVVQEGSP